MPKRVNHDPNNNGENWGQFLKDIADPQVQAILNDDPAARLNRKGARALGYHNKAEALDEAIKREEAKAEERKAINHGRALTMGIWWRDTFEVLLPKWAYQRVLDGNQNICRLLGYQWGSDDGNDMVEDKTKPLGHKLQPYSRAWITRKRFVLFGAPVLCKIKVKHWNEQEKKEELVTVETWKKFIWEGK